MQHDALRSDARRQHLVSSDVMPPARRSSLVSLGGYCPTRRWLAGMAGALTLVCGTACNAYFPPDIQLEPTPAAEAVSSGEYRLSSLSLAESDQGLDLTGDSVADNHFPLALDLAYDSLHDAVVASLADSGVDPEAAWLAIDAALSLSGLPIGVDAYNAGFASGLESGRFLPLFSLSDQAGAISGQFSMGTETPSGVEPNGTTLGLLSGTGAPQSVLAGTSLVVPYPQSWFSLPVLGFQSKLWWDSVRLSDGSLGGAIMLSSLVTAILTPIPDTITVGDSTIEVPKDLIARNLTEALSTATTEDGVPICDLTVNEDPAISAYYLFYGQRVN